jgi:hypothetical protein
VAVLKVSAFGKGIASVRIFSNNACGLDIGLDIYVEKQVMWKNAGKGETGVRNQT